MQCQLRPCCRERNRMIICYRLGQHSTAAKKPQPENDGDLRQHSMKYCDSWLSTPGAGD